MKTTKADRDLFVKECKRWIDKLSLNDWEYSFEHEYIGENLSATTTSDFKAKMIVFRLNKEIDKTGKMSSYIKSIALHEVLHVLLENLYHMAKSRDFREINYLAEEHAIINRLQKAME